VKLVKEERKLPSRRNPHGCWRGCRPTDRRTLDDPTADPVKEMTGSELPAPWNAGLRHFFERSAGHGHCTTDLQKNFLTGL